MNIYLLVFVDMLLDIDIVVFLATKCFGEV